MFRRKPKFNHGTRNFRFLGLSCTQSDMTTPHAPPKEFYLYVPGMRLGATKLMEIRKAAWKYRLGFKEWYK
jgi:hypothetical protein